jgi:hypothetical protein
MPNWQLTVRIAIQLADRAIESIFILDFDTEVSPLPRTEHHVCRDTSAPYDKEHALRIDVGI